MAPFERRHFAIGFMKGTQAAVGVVDFAAILYAFNYNKFKTCLIVFGCTTVVHVIAQVMKKNLERGK